jgi:hypothetical protein
MSTTCIDLDGIILDVDYTFIKGKQYMGIGHPDNWEPDEPDEVIINSIEHKGVYIDDLLSDHVLSKIEDMTYHAVLEEKDGDAETKAAYKEDRKKDEEIFHSNLSSW